MAEPGRRPSSLVPVCALTLPEMEDGVSEVEDVIQSFKAIALDVPQGGGTLLNPFKPSKKNIQPQKYKKLMFINCSSSD